MTKILNVASHAIDLDDGHVLAPGETADVDTEISHNKSLVNAGSILVVEDAKPPRPPKDQTREDK